MVPAWIWMVALIVLVLGAAYGIRNQVRGLLGFRSDGVAVPTMPTVWWHVDDSQVNARHWLDWQDRGTNEPNEPYLQICKAKAERLWGGEFVVQPVIGRLAAIRRLEAAGFPVPEGSDRCPPALWMPWCRAAFLKQFGGLWLDGSVLPMATGTELRRRLGDASVLTFGVDPDEGLSSAEEGSAPAAGRCAGWAAAPGHPMWAGMERDLGALIAAGDASWSAPAARRSLRHLWDKHCSGVTRIDRVAEVSRDRYGRRLELETLLGETEWPTGSVEGGLWVPLPDGRDGLERASPWLWFLRMSPEQIRESEFVWARWAHQA
jgi:hypothetical protein